MGKSTTVAILLIACGFMGLAPSIAAGEPQSALNIADNDSVYIDGKSFQVIPGKAQGDATSQIKSLSARELGPGMIIIRSGNKLYIADAQSKDAGPAPNYAYDPRAVQPSLSGGGSAGYNANAATNYAYDPRAVQPSLSGGGSAGYNANAATNYAYDPQANPVRNPNPWANNYAYDPRAIQPTLSGGGSAGYNANAATNYAYDPQANPVRNPNPWANNYAYDPRAVQPTLSGGGSAGYNTSAATNYAYDPRAAAAQFDRPNRIRIQYDPPKNPDLQEIYGRLEDRQFLEKIQRILSPLRLPEELTVKTAECGMMNAWYKRENSKPTVTVCYELLKNISQSLPKQTTPSGITPADAAIGQAVWLVLHEVGHATFDMFRVPIFGHEENAADNFADYIMLQFGKGQARQLIGGAAWAWRGYVADYRTNPEIREQLAAFASNHGQPQERFYNLMCLAYGADPVTFADLTQDGFLPPSRSPNCKYEYKTLTDAFHQEISPHIDQEMARRVLDTSWLPAPQSMTAAQK
ncbi:MAG TPA: DUF4344 domain-containing metallopeptidase [Xanthobacteraceae bacterium]|nr:DUF4344 domain-containing metallopeptidase [Xanthobacteraceae bacterium]